MKNLFIGTIYQILGTIILTFVTYNLFGKIGIDVILFLFGTVCGIAWIIYGGYIIFRRKKIMDKTLIPKGSYCYEKLEYNGKGGFKIIGRCPYWKHRKDIDNAEVNENNYGYCLYLGKGDVELNKEVEYEISFGKDKGKMKSADEIGLPLSLLWDMCKMCNENIEEEDE